MEIQPEVLNKIKADLYRRSVIKNVGELSKMGDSEQEYGYSFNTSGVSGEQDIIFVISKKLKYHNQSLKDTEYAVYPYDSSGNYIENYDVKGKCGGTFFRNLKEIK